MMTEFKPESNEILQHYVAIVCDEDPEFELFLSLWRWIKSKFESADQFNPIWTATRIAERATEDGEWGNIAAILLVMIGLNIAAKQVGNDFVFNIREKG